MSPLAHSDGVNYTTGLAETRSIPFADSALLQMDALTTILVKEGGSRRSVYLAQGQIHASIQHGKSKPLDVVVHGILLRDCGTEFNVAAHGDVVTVSVTSGKVQVIELHPDGTQSNPIDIEGKSASRAPAYLIPGDLARLERHDEIVLITREDNNLDEARNRTSWIEGRITTGGERLDEILWEINARNKARVLIGDSAVAQMSIGGNYDLLGVEAFLQAARALGLDVVPVKGIEDADIPTYILRMPTEAPTLPKAPHVRPRP